MPSTPKPQYTLFRGRRFLPLFITQALEAFNDNALRSVLLVLATYQLSLSESHAGFISNLAAILFNLPFIFLSPIAGQVADKFNKTRLTRYIKLIEAVCMAIAGIAIIYHNLAWLLFCVFIMGVHSTFFGPIKYAILPDLLTKNKLLAANAWVESSTFVMILCGYIFGIFLIGLSHGLQITAFTMFFIALLGLVSSFLIPSQIAVASPQLTLKFAWWPQTRELFSELQQHPNLLTVVLIIAWFWYVGITLQVQFSNYSKYNLGAHSDVVMLLIAALALGVSAGAFACSRLLKRKNDTRLTPLALLCSSIFMLLFAISSPTSMSTSTQPLISVTQFLQMPRSWLLLSELFLLSAAAGLYVLPLYVLLQTTSKSHRARHIAAANIAAAVAMFAAAAIAIVLTALHFTAAELFAVTALLNLAVAFYACKLLPHSMLHNLYKYLLKSSYKIEVTGLDNARNLSGAAIICCNHSSYLDIPLLGCFLPRSHLFAVNKKVITTWWARPLLWLSKTILIEPENPMSMKTIIKELQKGQQIVVFPEGRMTVTGSLMKLYEGTAQLADMTKTVVIPVAINGMQFSRFCLSKHFVSRRRPTVEITIGSPQKLSVAASIQGKARREQLTLQLYDLMNNVMLAACDCQGTLFSALLKARSTFGKHRVCLADANDKQLSYQQLIMKSYAIGQAVQAHVSDNENVAGLMLATSLAAGVLFFAMQSIGIQPAMINFTAGARAIKNACQTAQITTIFTAKRFIEEAKLDHLALELKQAGLRLVYLEDMAAGLSLKQKLTALVYSRFDGFYQRQIAQHSDASNAAVILFTSGSEGAPKAVVLSHSNIHHNRHQVVVRVNVTMQDVVLNTLPMFHCFGLTMGTLLPVLNGIKTVLYPSPLHYRIIPELIYEHGVSILFSTNTFLMGYARNANPYDFYSIRYIFAGAESLKESTRKLYMDKFGVRIYEGYGVTETTPVAAVNTAMHYKAGTVGRVLPAMQTKLKAVPGIEQGGVLQLKGPNVMLGYIKHAQPGILQAADEWYDTGDIVDIDQQGFIKILGRAKRFAKLAGEMVSLSAVEHMVQELWPDALHAVIALQDERKGEQLLLITEHVSADLKDLLLYAQQQAYTELMVPKKIIHTESLPILGSGKVDYVRLSAEFKGP